MPTKSDDTLWRVLGIDWSGGTASLELLDPPTDDAQLPATLTEVAVEDLVVVAEFRDPIYPGLVSTGKVERGGDKPYHTVINAENYHAPETLLFTHRGKVDAIYIDPPYNTGDRSWKYNNDYVDGEDLYRHSKWLAFIERWLQIAKQLLTPDGTLIVTIGEDEVCRLGLLLGQVCPEARIQLVTIVMNTAGPMSPGEFSRADEYAFFCWFGSAKPSPMPPDLLSASSPLPSCGFRSIAVVV